jgi:serine/threonine protein kinase
MTDTRRDATPDTSQFGDLSGVSEMFGMRDGQRAGDESGTRLVRSSDWQFFGLPNNESGTSTDTEGRWAAVTEGDTLTPTDSSGRLVRGRYRLIGELGVGGMGVTYRAWDTTAGIPVVVKMPRREVRSDSEVMQRFAREIDAMLAVPHERIVPITDHGDDDGCPFVVMRFLPGGSLADYRRRDEAGNAIRNPPGMLHFWLPGVAAALDHIHAKGMLHRDVKPGNIFLDGFLNPYLGDFGIAKIVDESGGLQKEQTLTATQMAVGTPEYMAPELFTPRSKPSGSMDQYALAVTVYEMLSGEKPFKGDRAHIIVEHSAMPVPPLATKVPGLPQSLCVAVEKGLAKSAADRFSTCSEFAAAVVAELTLLSPEPDTVRLLCPSCKNILKLPQKAAGRTGRCPRCREAIDVAADLGSLWLEAEQRGGDLTVVDEHFPILPDHDVIRFPPLNITAARQWRRWFIILAALMWFGTLFYFLAEAYILGSGEPSFFGVVLTFVFIPLIASAILHYVSRVVFAIAETIGPMIPEVRLSEVGGGWVRGTCIDDFFAPLFLGRRGVYDLLTVAIQDIDHVKQAQVFGRRMEWTTFKLVCKAEPQRAPLWLAQTSAEILRHALKAKGITILDDDAP